MEDATETSRLNSEVMECDEIVQNSSNGSMANGKELAVWTKDEKFDLLQALKLLGSSIQMLVKNKPSEQIKEEVKYYEKKVSLHPTVVDRNTRERSAAGGSRVPLANWDTVGPDKLQTELPNAISLVTQFETIPPPVCTENIDFKKVYQVIANAVEGKPLKDNINIMEKESNGVPGVVGNHEEKIISTYKNPVRLGIKNIKKPVSSLSPDKREEYKERKRIKELERVLLPDAPAPKLKRQISPARAPCRLVAGTPEVPPLRIPQPWEVPSPGVSPPASPAYSEFRMPGESDNDNTSVASPLNFNWTTWEINNENWPRKVAQRAAAIINTPGLAARSPIEEDPPVSSPAPSPAPPSPAPEAKIAHDVAEDPWTPAPSPAPAARGSQTMTSHHVARELSLDASQARVQRRASELQSDDSNDDNNDDELQQEIEIQCREDFVNDSPALPIVEEQDWLASEDLTADQLVRSLVAPKHMEFEWSSDPETFQGKRDTFRGQSGPTFAMDINTKPLDIFLKYFDDEVMEHIVSETNRQINTIRQPLKKYSRYRDVNPTNKAEMCIFLAILVYQGLCPLPVEKDYFNQNGFLTLAYFRHLMCYKRFIVLKKMLHFTSDQPHRQSVDQAKLRKLGPLLRMLGDRFRELYRPSRDIVIDESLLKWQGRLSFAQKIATKAAKVGVKTYELCESETGYLWNFFIYTGKGHKGERPDSDAGEYDDDGGDETVGAPRNATAQIVIELVKPLLNLGHTLTMDNFYNSPLLARYLKAHGTDCMGTLRVSREFVPESIKNTAKGNLEQGEVAQSYCRDISVLLWRDKNLVSMLSTFHPGEIGGKTKHGTFKYKPEVVLDYNLAMGGVDKKDQLLSAHLIERSRNLAWYKKVFRRLLNVTVLNSYIIFKTQNPKATQRDFRVTLADDIVRTFRPAAIEKTLVPVQEVATELVIKTPRNGQERPILTGNHFVGKGATRSKVCAYCRKSRTAFICKQCHVSLCLDICFEDYHTKP